jgi:hypothetical protein
MDANTALLFVVSFGALLDVLLQMHRDKAVRG